MTVAGRCPATGLEYVQVPSALSCLSSPCLLFIHHIQKVSIVSGKPESRVIIVSYQRLIVARSDGNIKRVIMMKSVAKLYWKKVRMAGIVTIQVLLIAPNDKDLLFIFKKGSGEESAEEVGMRFIEVMDRVREVQEDGREAVSDVSWNGAEELGANDLILEMIAAPYKKVVKEKEPPPVTKKTSGFPLSFSFQGRQSTLSDAASYGYAPRSSLSSPRSLCNTTSEEQQQPPTPAPEEPPATQPTTTLHSNKARPPIVHTIEEPDNKSDQCFSSGKAQSRRHLIEVLLTQHSLEKESLGRLEATERDALLAMHKFEVFTLKRKRELYERLNQQEAEPAPQEHRSRQHKKPVHLEPRLLEVVEFLPPEPVVTEPVGTEAVSDEPATIEAVPSESERITEPAKPSECKPHVKPLDPPQRQAYRETLAAPKLSSSSARLSVSTPLTPVKPPPHTASAPALPRLSPRVGALHSEYLSELESFHKTLRSLNLPPAKVKLLFTCGIRCPSHLSSVTLLELQDCLEADEITLLLRTFNYCAGRSPKDLCRPIKGRQVKIGDARRGSVFAGPEGQEFKEGVKATLSVLQRLCDGGSTEEAEEELRSRGVMTRDKVLMEHLCAVFEDTVSKLQDSEANLLRAAEYGTFLVEEHRREKADLEQEIDDLRRAHKKLREENDALSAEVVLWKGWDVREHNNEIRSDEQKDLTVRERDMLRIKNHLQNEVKKLMMKNKDLEVERNVLLTEISMLREENTEVTNEIKTIDEINQRLGREVSFVRRRERERDHIQAEEAAMAAAASNAHRRPVSPVSPAACGEALGYIFDTDCSEQSVLESFLETPTITLKSKETTLVSAHFDSSVSSDEGRRHGSQTRSGQLKRIKELQDDIDDWQEKYHTLQLMHEQHKAQFYTALCAAHALIKQTQHDMTALKEDMAQMSSHVATSTSPLLPAVFSHLAIREFSDMAHQGLRSHAQTFGRKELTASNALYEVPAETSTVECREGYAQTASHLELFVQELCTASAIQPTDTHWKTELEARDAKISVLEGKATASTTTTMTDEVRCLKEENATLIAQLAKNTAETASLLNIEKESTLYKERVTQQLAAAELECSVLKQEVAMLNKSFDPEVLEHAQHVKELKEQCEKQAAELRMRNAEFKSLLLEHKQLADAKGYELGNEKQKLADATRRINLLEETIHRMSQEALDMKEEKEILKRSRGSLLVKVKASETEINTLRSQISTSEPRAGPGPASPDSALRSILDKYKVSSRKDPLQLKTLYEPTSSHERVGGRLGMPKPCVKEVPSVKRSGSDQYELNIINGVRLKDEPNGGSMGRSWGGPYTPSTTDYHLPQRKERSVENTTVPPRGISVAQAPTAKQPFHAIVQRIATEVGGHMGKRKAQKTPDVRGGVSSVTSSQQAEALLGSWTTREIQNKLQCSPEEAQHCATLILSMDNKQLREWCTNLLGDLEKRVDDDRKFYNVFLDKKEELGLVGNSTPSSQISDTASECGSVASTATSKSKRKFNKQVDISKVATGHDALFPTSQECGCEATRHKLLTNCQLCGKIVCEQEGWGRCYFCGTELSKEAKPVRGKNDTDDDTYLTRQRDFLKAVAARDKLIQYQEERSKRTTIFDDQEDYYESSNPWLDPEERRKAAEKEKQAKEARIARHKKGGAYTVHIDFVNKNITEGLTCSASQQAVTFEAPIEKRAREEKEKGQEATGEEEANVHVAHSIYTTDPVKVVEEVSSGEDDEGNRVKTVRVMRNPDAKVVTFDSSAMLGGWVRSKLVSYGFDDDEAEKQGNMVKRMTNMGAVRGWAKQNLDEELVQEFIDDFTKETRRLETVAPKKRAADPPMEKEDTRRGMVKGTGRLQSDWEEIDDAYKAPVENMVKSIGKKKPWVYINSEKAAKIDKASGVKESTMCLSMHQPWASLLVCGIKKHEGRTWPTDFRGRLWIHAASHQPSQEDIDDCEAFYADRGATTFPTHYPTSVLLGCVTVTDCLHYEEYEKVIPQEDQESSSEYVFICANPQLLVLPLPMDGKHKIFSLEKSIYEAAKRQAGRKGI